MIFFPSPLVHPDPLLLPSHPTFSYCFKTTPKPTARIKPRKQNIVIPKKEKKNYQILVKQ